MKGILCKYNSKEEKIFRYQTYVFCNLKQDWVPAYQCNKHHCPSHAFEPVVSVNVPVGRCDECPYHYTKPNSEDWEFNDYFCKITRSPIAKCIEWDTEIPAVPEWCPFRSKEEVNEE